MRPLRIEWDIATPVVADDAMLHLDGMLAWAAADIAIEDGIPPDEAVANLPLEKQVRGDDWVWKASAVEFMREGMPQNLVYRRSVDFGRMRDMHREIGGFEYRRKNAELAYVCKGVSKRWQLQTATVWARHAVAWCVGDPEQVRKLLGRLHYLGKLARLGCGRVAKVSVTEDEAALKRWKWRHLPWREDGYVPIEGCTSPPYWRRDQTRACWRPSASANL